MKCTVLVMLALATLVSVGAAQVTFLDTPVADKNQDQGRNVTGQVMTKAETPLPDAVVYLKNTKTLAVKSYFSQKDGAYRFPELPLNTDFDLQKIDSDYVFGGGYGRYDQRSYYMDFALTGGSFATNHAPRLQAETRATKPACRQNFCRDALN